MITAEGFDELSDGLAHARQLRGNLLELLKTYKRLAGERRAQIAKLITELDECETSQDSILSELAELEGDVRQLREALTTQ